AVVASNDATAGGAIQALSAQGLSGKVAISGQDADLAGIKRIAAGTQTMTVYKPITLLANTAEEIAVEFGNGKDVSYTHTRSQQTEAGLVRRVLTQKKKK
ncbi:substrate-binding domain-containing protein, partial [Escherichia coli]|uniref:substrate-binding domain-containing protein n=1 Tax=Escherichia coli TaxID=562 RepID=UPI00207B746B